MSDYATKEALSTLARHALDAAYLVEQVQTPATCLAALDCVARLHSQAVLRLAKHAEQVRPKEAITCE